MPNMSSTEMKSKFGAGLSLMMTVQDVAFSRRITQQRFGQEFVRPMKQAAAL
jgi:hypothetical protein